MSINLWHLTLIFNNQKYKKSKGCKNSSIKGIIPDLYAFARATLTRWISYFMSYTKLPYLQVKVKQSSLANIAIRKWVLLKITDSTGCNFFWSSTLGQCNQLDNVAAEEDNGQTGLGQSLISPVVIAEYIATLVATSGRYTWLNLTTHSLLICRVSWRQWQHQSSSSLFVVLL